MLIKDDDKDYANDPKQENKDHGFMKGDDLRKSAMEVINNRLDINKKTWT